MLDLRPFRLTDLQVGLVVRQVVNGESVPAYFDNIVTKIWKREDQTSYGSKLDVPRSEFLARGFKVDGWTVWVSLARPHMSVSSIGTPLIHLNEWDVSLTDLLRGFSTVVSSSYDYTHGKPEVRHDTTWTSYLEHDRFKTGKWSVRGLDGVSPQVICDMISRKISREEIEREYPVLTYDAIQACLIWEQYRKDLAP